LRRSPPRTWERHVSQIAVCRLLSRSMHQRLIPQQFKEPCSPQGKRQGREFPVIGTPVRETSRVGQELGHGDVFLVRSSEQSHVLPRVRTRSPDLPGPGPCRPRPRPGALSGTPGQTPYPEPPLPVSSLATPKASSYRTRPVQPQRSTAPGKPLPGLPGPSGLSRRHSRSRPMGQWSEPMMSERMYEFLTRLPLFSSTQK